MSVLLFSIAVQSLAKITFKFFLALVAIDGVFLILLEPYGSVTTGDIKNLFLSF